VDSYISPGFLYFKSRMSAPASVGPGQTFVLGTQTFLNSVDDPVNGTSSVIYPRTLSPCCCSVTATCFLVAADVLRFLSKVGVAYTGAPQIASISTGLHAPPKAASTSHKTPTRRSS